MTETPARHTAPRGLAGRRDVLLYRIERAQSQNLMQNSHCLLTTGCNRLNGLDLVVEGEAAKVIDETELRSVADAYEAKYGAHLTAPEGTWFGLGEGPW